MLPVKYFEYVQRLPFLGYPMLAHSIMAYGSTPFVRMTLEENGGHIKST